MEIKLIGPVLFVRDIQVGHRFYEELLGQQVDLDLGANVGFKSGEIVRQMVKG